MPIVQAGDEWILTGRQATPYTEVRIHRFQNGPFGEEYVVTADGRYFLENHRFEKGQYFDIVHGISLMNLPASPKIALIGGAAFVMGAVLTKMAPWAGKDVYELCGGFAEWVQQYRNPNRFGWNWIVGDWKTTITGVYDVIVYDADEPLVNLPLLRAHLTPVTGKVFVFV